MWVEKGEDLYLDCRPQTPFSTTQKHFVNRLCFLADRTKFYINDIYWKHKKVSKGFPGGSDGKESACNATDESGRSLGEGNGYSLQPSCLENSIEVWEFHSPGKNAQRSLAGYSPYALKESDTTEWLTLLLSQYFLCHVCYTIFA